MVQIFINGHHLEEEAEELEGIIGYIPQDDLLIEELTVYQNLYFNARLCLNGYTEKEIEEAVVNVLNDLDLFDGQGSEGRISPEKVYQRRTAQAAEHCAGVNQGAAYSFRG